MSVVVCALGEIDVLFLDEMEAWPNKRPRGVVLTGAEDHLRKSDASWRGWGVQKDEVIGAYAQEANGEPWTKLQPESTDETPRPGC
jgi:hypothetical protein